MERKDYICEIDRSWSVFPVVALLGPRQVGKTTSAQVYGRQYDRGSVPATHYFDLEDPGTIARLQTPKLTLEPLSGLIMIDEIQRQPELFPLLRVLADTKRQDTRFLILGSA